MGSSSRTCMSPLCAWGRDKGSSAPKRHYNSSGVGRPWWTVLLPSILPRRRAFVNPHSSGRAVRSPLMVPSSHVARSCCVVLSIPVARSVNLALSPVMARSFHMVLSPLLARSMNLVLSNRMARSCSLALLGRPGSLIPCGSLHVLGSLPKSGSLIGYGCRSEKMVLSHHLARSPSWFSQAI